MYGLIGKMMAAPGRRDELITMMLGEAAPMPGCLSYVIACDPKEPDAVWITEVWDSAASHKASLEIPTIRATIAKAMPLIAGFGMSVEVEPVGGHGLKPG